MSSKSIFRRAFTLLEILGAAALITTLATISVISVKDSVAAGQRASVQRELQGLNTSLANFKSAGGVIPDNASVADAIAALQTGVSIAGTGSNYAPLTSVPDLSMMIGGVPYEYVYDPVNGFSCAPVEGSGETFTGSGVGGTQDSGSTYPFDITNSAAMAQALADFAGMSPTDAAYQSYVDAFNAAISMQTLPVEDLRAAGAAIDRQFITDADIGLYLTPVSFSDAEVIQKLFDNYGSNWRDSVPLSASWEIGHTDLDLLATSMGYEYVGVGDTAAFLLASGFADQEAFANDRGYASFDEMGTAYFGYPISFEAFVKTTSGYFVPGSRAAVWASDAGFASVTDMARALYGPTVYPTLDSAQIDEISSMMPVITPENLAMLSANPSAQSVDNAKLLMNSLNSALASGAYSDWSSQQAQDPLWDLMRGAAASSASTDPNSSRFGSNGANADYRGLAGVNLSAFNATGRDLWGLNLSVATGITGEKLNAAAGLANVNFAGLDLSRLDMAGKSLCWSNLVGTGVTGSQLNSPSIIMLTDLSGLNLDGFFAGGRRLDNVNFSNCSNLTVAQIVSAESGSIHDVNFVGTGITQAALDAALILAGKAASANCSFSP